MHGTRTTTIRIKVPDQEFSAILLLVELTDVMRHIRSEITDQLNIKYPDRQAYALVSALEDGQSEPTFFPMNWTLENVLDKGVKEFELIRVDMLQ
jgi:hypothetical protein